MSSCNSKSDQACSNGPPLQKQIEFKLLSSIVRVISVTVDYRLELAQWTPQQWVKCAVWQSPSSSVRLHSKEKNRKEKTFILQRQKTLMRMVAMCWGRFSGVINKVCGKQRGTQSLWFTGNGWCLPQGGITTASCLKKYHKDQANPPITPTWSSSEEFMENGKGWSPINTDAIVCRSQSAACYTMLFCFTQLYPYLTLPPPSICPPPPPVTRLPCPFGTWH